MANKKRISNSIVGDDWVKSHERAELAKPWVARFAQAKDNMSEWKKVYASYITSTLWKGIRDEAILAAGGNCQKCGRKFSRLEVHHKNYDRVGGLEKPEDLEALCTPCHQEADKVRDRNTSQKGLDSLFASRVNSYVSRVTKDGWGEEWGGYHTREEAEEYFLQALYRKYCEKHHESCNYESAEFEWFCEDVRNGVDNDNDDDDDDDDDDDGDSTDGYFFD